MTEPAIQDVPVTGARPRSSTHRPPRPAHEPLPTDRRGARGPVSPAAALRWATPARDSTTLFHCCGCETSAWFAHADQRYGRLVHRFLDQHGRCGNAVDIAPGSSASALAP